MASKKKATRKRASKAKSAAPSKSKVDSGAWISIAEAAKACGRAPAQFYNWKSQGKAPFPMKVINGRTVVDATALRAWADTHPKRKRRAGRKPGRRPAGAKALSSAAKGSYCFSCSTTEDLQNWAGFLQVLSARGVKVRFSIGDGKITIV